MAAARRRIWGLTLGLSFVTAFLIHAALVGADRPPTSPAERAAARRLNEDRKRLGPDSLEIATDLVALAKVYRENDRYSDTERTYRRALAIAEKRDPVLAADILEALARFYAAYGHSGEADPAMEGALTIRERVWAADDPRLGRGQLFRALILYDLDRYSAAKPHQTEMASLLERGLASVEPGGQELPRVLATSFKALAGVYKEQKRLDEAERLFRRSLAIIDAQPTVDRQESVPSLRALGEIFAGQKRFPEAEDVLRRGFDICNRAFREQNAAFDTYSEIFRIAEALQGVLAAQNRYAEAEDMARICVKLAEDTGSRLARDAHAPPCLDRLGAVYEQQNRLVEAEAAYKQALAIREARRFMPRVAISLNTLGALYRKERRLDEAYAMTERVLSGLTRDRLAGSDGSRQLRRALLLRAALLYERHAGAEEGFALPQLAGETSAAQAVERMAARFAAGSDPLAAAVREQQDLQRQWDRVWRKLLEIKAQPYLPADPVAALSQQLAAIEARRKAVYLRIAREFPQYDALTRPEPLPARGVQGLLGPDEAMLVFLVGDDESWLWALRGERVEYFRLDIGDRELTEQVAKLRERLSPALNPALAPFDAERAYALYVKLVAPAADLIEGAHEIFVVPDRALDSLPVGVLVTKSPAENPRDLAGHRDIAWFARDHALTVLPSVGSLRALRRFAKHGHAPDPFIGIGNPMLKGAPEGARGVRLASLFRGGMADVDAVRALSPLPETADELRAVAKNLGAGAEDLYLAERASEPLLRQAHLERYRVIEFATHGLMSGDLEGLAEPALVLTPPATATPENDGLLTASKVATLKLDADWVVLSACNTAASDGTPDAGGLSGLAKAFFYAGARSILVSHWSVASQATVKLIVDAFDELNRHPGIGRAEALRRAEMAMLDPKNPPEFAHPMIWAPFVLAGEGGAGR